MRLDVSSENARKLNIRLTVTAVLLGASVATNLVQSVYAVNARQVVLVPTLPEELAVKSGGVLDTDYFHRVVRDVTYLFLNRTPETSQYFERAVEKIADARTYQTIKAALAQDRAERFRTRTSQAFFPEDFYVNPGRLYAEVRGTLETSTGPSMTARERKIYALRFVRRGSAVRLTSFTEIRPSDSEAEDVKPQTPDTNEVLP
jgi:conjugal transfer pilus assembly protein TraE